MTPYELLQRRIALGMSQGDLAAYLGVKQSSVSAWERGTRSIPPVEGELRILEERFAILVDRMLEIGEQVLEQEGELTLMVHTDDKRFWAAHPELDGLPVAIHAAAARIASLFLMQAHDGEIHLMPY